MPTPLSPTRTEEGQGRGGRERAELHCDDPGDPHPLQPKLFELSFDEEPSGSRPDRLAGARPKERAQRHTLEQIVDSVPGLPMLDVLVPLMVELLVDVLRFFDALLPVAEQVIRRAQDHRRVHPVANVCLRTAAGGTVGGSVNSLLLPQADR